MSISPEYLEKDLFVVLERLASTIEVPVESISATYQYVQDEGWCWVLEAFVPALKTTFISCEPGLADSVIDVASQFATYKLDKAGK